MIKKLKAILLKKFGGSSFVGWILDKQKVGINSRGNNDIESLLDFCLDMQFTHFYYSNKIFLNGIGLKRPLFY